MPTFMIEDVFECPHCGHNSIDEVLENVTAYSLVQCIGAGGDCEYSPVSVDNTDETECRYECFQCGEILVKKDGSPIRSAEELYKYLNAMRKGKEKKNG